MKDTIKKKVTVKVTIKESRCDSDMSISSDEEFEVDSSYTVDDIKEGLKLLGEKKGVHSHPYPKKGTPYWFIGSGGIISNPLIWDDSQTDKEFWSIGNVFLTKEEAEQEVERRKIHQELQELAGFWEPDWGGGYKKAYIIEYDRSIVGVTWIDSSWKIANIIYFETEQLAQSAIDTIGEERLKIYFGVK